MPLTIEMVSPKWTLDGISLIVSFAIGALERVRAGFALLGFESGWVNFIISFTAPTELSVMFRLVGAIAFGTSCSLDPTRHGGMAPLPTVLAEWNTGVHVCASDGGDMVSYIKASVNKHFCVLTALNVPDVDPHYGHVRFWRDLDYSWF